MISNTVIAKNNDTLRRLMVGQDLVPGTIFQTAGVDSLPDEEQRLVRIKVQNFDAFNEDNDPYGEHDFGSVQVLGEKYFWKIDYFEDATCEFGFDFQTADKDEAFRVLTIMKADEY